MAPVRALLKLLQNSLPSSSLSPCLVHRYSPLLQSSTMNDFIRKQSTKTNPLESGEIKSATEILNSLDSEMTRKLKILKMEYDVWQSFGRKVPDHLSDEQWLEILTKHITVSSRMKYYRYLFKIEKAEDNEQKKKEIKKIEREKLQAEKQIAMAEGTFKEKNTFMLYIREQTMNKIYYNNIYHSMLHGPHLVFDMGFGDEMTRQELTRLTSQLLLSHGVNKISREPFHFHFCNVEPGSKSEDVLRNRLPGKDLLPVTVSQDSYLDLYPKEKLVYLSPNSRQNLEKFNPDEIYIIGGLVDLAVETPLTYAKAKQEGLRCVRLPLDKHLRWKMGTKALTLDQMVKILLTLSSSESDWEQAFKHIPKRKIY